MLQYFQVYSLEQKQPTINNNPKKPWIIDSTWKLINGRQEAKSKGISQEVELSIYNGLTWNINQALRKDKNKFITDICTELNQHSNKYEPKISLRKYLRSTISFSERRIKTNTHRIGYLGKMASILRKAYEIRRS